MKLPSIRTLADSLATTFLRFSTALLLTVTGAIVSIRYIHLPYGSKAGHYYYNNLIMCCYMGALLQIAITIYTERRKTIGIPKALLLAGALVLTVLYYFILPMHYTQASAIRFVLFALGLHLSIAIIPFIGKKESNGFWQYNKTLFLRILSATLYSGVLYIGLALALFAIEKLFNVSVNSNLYADLWIVIAGVFNTCFFLAGFPRDIEALNNDTSYPKGLKIFTQYVLLPLITVYLLILYAYMCRIVITAQWPAGWVAWLVMGFSVAGILSLLLIYPIRNDANNKWILAFSRFFYFAICPLIVLLLLAAQRRISEYGITELRYFIVALGVWLAAIAVYFLVSAQKNIKLIPLSLCILAFATSFGPWSAFSVSFHNQQSRLIKVLERNSLFNGRKIVPATKAIPVADAKEITSIVEYMTENHGYQSLQPYFTQNLDSALKSEKETDYSYSYQQYRKLMALMNVKYTDRFSSEEENKEQSFFFNTDNDHQVIPVQGYDYLVKGIIITNYAREDSVTNSYLVNRDSIRFCLYNTPNTLLIRSPNDSTITFDLAALVRSLKTAANPGNMPVVQMTVQGSNRRMAFTLLVNGISGRFVKDSVIITRFTTDVLIRSKNG